MSCSKERKVDTENRQFKREWTEQFCFAMVGLTKPMCLICNEVVSVIKVCNLKRHYESKHKEFHSKFPPGSSLRQRKLSSMQLSYTQGSSMIRGGSSAQDKCTEASLRVSWILCKNMIPFTHAEVVKECTLQIVKVMEGEETVKKFLYQTILQPGAAKNLHKTLVASWYLNFHRVVVFPWLLMSLLIFQIQLSCQFLSDFLMGRDLWRNY